MKVYLLKDIERVGIVGEVIQVGNGYARNYLIPRKLAVEITPQNSKFYEGRVKKVEHRKEVVASKTSMLAEKIKSLNESLSEVDRILDKMEKGEESGILIQIDTEGDTRTIRVPPCCVQQVSGSVLAQLTVSRGEIITEIQQTALELSEFLKKPVIPDDTTA